MTMRCGACILGILLAATIAAGQQPATAPVETQPASQPTSFPSELGKLLPDAESPGGFSTTLKWVAVITVISLVPAVLVMVTCFTRIIVVLGLLRQALATQQIPPNQILFGLALFMTVVVMMPVYRGVQRDAIAPYAAGRMTQAEAFRAGEANVRKFMIRQIEGENNQDDVYLFLDEDLAGRDDLKWSDVPTVSLIPAFVVSELKIAFYLGFRIFLPFVIVDMLVASVLVSMGMLMVPPVLVSLPFKLLLFVLADGWHLVVGTLMHSFG